MEMKRRGDAKKRLRKPSRNESGAPAMIGFMRSMLRPAVTQWIG
jgi:hypothetical protein